MKQTGYIVISLFLLLSVTAVASAADLFVDNLLLPVTANGSGTIDQGNIP